MIVLAILAFIFGIGLIILVHEAGHFYCARKAGILCPEFSIGMGPAIWKKKFKETTLVIRAIPIGGYVAMADSSLETTMIKVGNEIGLNLDNGCVKEILLDTSMDCEVVGIVKAIELLGAHGEELEVTLDLGEEEKTYPILRDAFIVGSPKEKVQITPYERSFDSKKISRRAITMSAGVVMNFVLAIFLYILIYFIQGVPNYKSTTIGSVSAGYIAEELGMVEGDKIVSINGEEFSSWTEFSEKMESISSLGETQFKLVYQNQKGEKIENTVNASFAMNDIGLSNIGIKEEYINDGSSNNSSVPYLSYGVQVGNVALKYGKNSKSDIEIKEGTPTISNGDYIISMKVFNSKDEASGDFIEVNSWKDIVSALSYLNGDVGYVKFKYFDQQTYDDKLTIEEQIKESEFVYTYSNALLEGQGYVKYKTYLGVAPEYHFSFFGCLKSAFVEFGSSATIIFRTLKELVAPTASVREVGMANLSGFVGIFDMIKSSISSGFLSYLSLLALLSVNIGIMNLIPIPALDGGRLVFLGYEAITHKKPSKKVENILNNIVYILLIALFIFVTYNDIVRLFSK